MFEILELNRFCNSHLPAFIKNPGLKAFTIELLKILFDILSDERFSSGIEVNFTSEPIIKKTNSEITVPVDDSVNFKPKSIALQEQRVTIDIDDSSAPLRPRLIEEARKYLFIICSDKVETYEDLELGQLCLPMLIRYSNDILTYYAETRPKIGRFPFPKYLTLTRSKNTQIITYLNALKELRLPQSKITIESILSHEVVKEYLKTCPIGHLFQLFMPFCQLLGVLVGSVYNEDTHGNGSTGGEETLITDLIRECLGILGNYLV